VQELLKLFPCKFHRAGIPATQLGSANFSHDFKTLKEPPPPIGPNCGTLSPNSRIRDHWRYQKMHGWAQLLSSPKQDDTKGEKYGAPAD
jgi:hypothetical protein